MIIIEIIINLTQIVEVTQVWKNEGATLDRRVIFFIHFFYFFYFFKFFLWKKEGATLDRKVMVRTIIIVIVSARGAKTPSIMV